MWPPRWWRYDGLVADYWSGRRLGAQVGYLGAQPLELGPFVRAQGSLGRPRGTVRACGHYGTISKSAGSGHHP
jgi:hypothetical protein